MRRIKWDWSSFIVKSHWCFAKWYFAYVICARIVMDTSGIARPDKARIFWRNTSRDQTYNVGTGHKLRKIFTGLVEITLFWIFHSWEELFAGVITIASATKMVQVFPLVILGIRINSSLHMPELNHNWATVYNEDWWSVDATGCVERSNLGFSCPTRYFGWRSSSITSNHTMYRYKVIKVIHFNHSIVHKVSEHCICVNTLCPKVMIKNWFTYLVKRHSSTFCTCEIFKIQGCDITSELP